MRQMRGLRHAVLTVVVAIPLVLAIGWTVYPAVLAAWGAYTLPMVTVEKGDGLGSDEEVAIKRQVQKHFLSHDTYVPLEDIIPTDGLDSKDEAALLMQKACGRGRLFIWIPLKFNLPLYGEKVYEWCWKPQTKDP